LLLSERDSDNDIVYMPNCMSITNQELPNHALFVEKPIAWAKPTRLSFLSISVVKLSKLKYPED